jgi:hypothetical protein
MDPASTAINAAVVAAVGVILAWYSKGRFDALDRRMDRMQERLDDRIDGVQTSIDAMRSDLTQVALAVGVRPRATNG